MQFDIDFPGCNVPIDKLDDHISFRQESQSTVLNRMTVMEFPGKVCVHLALASVTMKRLGTVWNGLFTLLMSPGSPAMTSPVATE
jgi:hypothetical protein